MSITKILAMSGLMLAGQSALAGTISTTHDFTGTSTTNWGWDSKTDTNTQLSGTNEMRYTYAAPNGKSYVTNTITDAATVFPNGTGTITMKLRVDLSHYPTGISDFSGPQLMTLGDSVGNKNSFTGGGMISEFNIAGLNNPGEYRFGTHNSMQYSQGSYGGSSTISVGANPAFALVYDLTLVATVTGSAATSWTITTDGSATGPIDTLGTIGTITIPTITKTAVNIGWTGLAAANAYYVGDNGYQGTGASAGSYITFDSFSANLIPEPASLGLLALGGLMMVHRGRR